MANTIGRNAPCPCGSGRKYKQCCAKREQTARAEDSVLQRRRDASLDLERRTVDLIFQWLARSGVDPMEGCPIEAEEEDVFILAAPFMAYDFGDGRRSWLGEFLDECGSSLTSAERRWLHAQGRVVVGLWEVLELQPGRSMRVRDRFTGEERVVFERSASRMLTPHAHLVGRVVDWEHEALFCGTWPRAFSPREADQLHDITRQNLARMLRYPKKRTLRPDEMRDPRAASLLLQLAEQASEAFDSAPPPTLQNTDGEPFVLCRDRFGFESLHRETLLAGLVGMDGAERESESGELPARFALTRPGNAQHKDWDNTVIAGVELHRARLDVSTNSVERADSLRRRLEAQFPQLRFAGRSEEVPEPGDMPGGPRLGEVPGEAEQQAMRQVLEGHLRAWPDEPLPALGGQSARQAVKTASGREKVERLLRDMAFNEQRMPEWQRMGVDRLRVALGL